MSSETNRVIRLSILGSVAILPVLILPAMVGALIDYAAFTESEAGWLAAAGFAGSAIGAVVTGLRIRHFDPAKLAFGGLIALAIFDALAALVAIMPVELFVVLRFMSGLSGAVVYAAVMASIAATANPERGYGIFMVLQFGLSAIGLYGLPYVLPIIGAVGMYLGLAAAALLSLLLAKSVVHREAAIEEPAIEIHMLMRPAAILAMLGIGLYESANFMQYTYAERIGITFNLSHVEIGEVLGIASLLGVPAALLVVWIGDRFGQLGPLLVAIAASVIAHLMLYAPDGPASFAIAVFMLGMAWAFGLAYFYAFEARLDPGGSVIVVGGFFTASGSVAGPALAAALVQPDDFRVVLASAIGLYCAAAILVLLSAACIRARQ
jgi:MFS family permease